MDRSTSNFLFCLSQSLSLLRIIVFLLSMFTISCDCRFCFISVTHFTSLHSSTLLKYVAQHTAYAGISMSTKRLLVLVVDCWCVTAAEATTNAECTVCRRLHKYAHVHTFTCAHTHARVLSHTHWLSNTTHRRRRLFTYSRSMSCCT